MTMTADGNGQKTSRGSGFGMPHAIAAAVIGASIYAGLRYAAERLERLALKAAARAEAEARARRSGVATAREAGTLVWDDAVKAYRVK